MRELAVLVAPGARTLAPDAFVDLGAIFRDPTDIVIGIEQVGNEAANIARVLHGVLGHGYATLMRPSPLLHRLATIRDELVRGGDTFDRKLRYLIWIN